MRRAAEAFDKIVALSPDDSMALFNAAVVKKYYLHKHDEADAQLKLIYLTILNPLLK